MQQWIAPPRYEHETLAEGYAYLGKWNITGSKPRREKRTFQTKGQLLNFLKRQGFTEIALRNLDDGYEEFLHKVGDFRRAYELKAMAQNPTLPFYLLRKYGKHSFEIEKRDLTSTYSKKFNLRPGFGIVEAIYITIAPERHRIFITRGHVTDMAHSVCFDPTNAEVHDTADFKDEMEYLSAFELSKTKHITLNAEKVRRLFTIDDFAKRKATLLTDEDLVLRIKNEDNLVWAELYRRCLPQLRKISKEFHACADDPEDLLQIGGLSLMDAVKQYDGRQYASFRTFLSTVFRNDLIDFRRSLYYREDVRPKVSLDTRMGNEQLEDAIMNAWNILKLSDSNGNTSDEQQPL